MATEPRYLTQAEAAEYLRLSVRVIRNETAAGRLRAARIGRRVLYTAEDLDAFFQARRAEGPNPPS